MRFHKLQNVQIALDFLKHRQVGHDRLHLLIWTTHSNSSLWFLTCFAAVSVTPQVKLVNIRNDDIADGNPKLTLGLIWTIILHFQVSTSVSVVFHFLILAPPLSLGSVGCGFPTPRDESEWDWLFVIPLRTTLSN